MSLDIDFADLFARMPSPYMMLDREMRFIDANEAYLAITGRQRDDLDDPSRPGSRSRRDDHRVAAEGARRSDGSRG